MTNSKKIFITTETSEVFIVRYAGKTDLLGFCARCASQTKILTLDEAVSYAGTHTRELIRRLDAGAVHSLETASGHLLFCQNSLIDSPSS
jgi:hypothetical protein